MLFKKVLIGLLVGLLLVTTGHSQTVKASSFGFDREDATRAFQRALTSSYDSIVIDDQGVPWKVKPSWFTGIKDKIIIFEPGVILQQKEGAYKDRLAMLFRLEKCSNLKIIGYGATFKMDKKELRGLKPWSEFRNSIALYDCSDIVIQGLTVEESGGDGLLISTRSENGFCSNIRVEDVVFKDHYRQGMTITALEGGVFRNCTFEGTLGTLPEAGVDFEPNYSTQCLSNITFRNCSFINNGHAGILFAVSKTDGETTPLDVKFYDCHLSGNNRNENIRNGYKNRFAAEIDVGMTRDPGNPLQGSIYFERTFIEHFPYLAFATKKTGNAFKIAFRDLVIYNEEALRKEDTPPLQISRYNYRSSEPPAGGIHFDHFLVDIPNKSEFMSLSGDRWFNWKVRDFKVVGTVISDREKGIRDERYKITGQAKAGSEITVKLREVGKLAETKVQLERAGQGELESSLIRIRRASKDLGFPLMVQLEISYLIKDSKAGRILKKVVLPSNSGSVDIDLDRFSGPDLRKDQITKIALRTGRHYELGARESLDLK